MLLSAGSQYPATRQCVAWGTMSVGTGVRRPGRLALALAALALLPGSLGRAVEASAKGDPSTALADMSIEQLVDVEVASVYGASRYEQKVTQAPSSVSIVTADDIQRYGYGTLADVLNSVRGMYVSSDRNYSYAGIRGFLRPGDYNTRLLVLVDGHRINDNIYDAAYLDRGLMVDVDLIDRVEIIRGPSSSIYGSSAFLGVVNVITKRGAQFANAEFSAEAGSYDTYAGRFSLGGKSKNDIEVLVSGSVYDSAGPEKLYYSEFDPRVTDNPLAANDGIAERRDGEEAFSLFGSAKYHELTLSAFYGDRRKDIPTASYGTLFNDGKEKTQDQRAYVDLKWEHDFNPDSRLTGRVYWDRYDYSGYYPYDYAAPGEPPEPVLYEDSALGDWVGSNWQWTQELFDRHKLIVGAEYRENLRQDQETRDVIDGEPVEWEDSRTSRDLGLFVQAELSLRTNLCLNAGVRYDHYFEGFGGTLNPRLGLIYNPWERTTLKALFGQAFRAPNCYEQYYFLEQPLHPALDPETIRTYELVCEQYLPHNHRLTLAGYYYTVDDIITQTKTPSGGVYFGNLEGARALGVEFEVEGLYANGLRGRVSYGLQHASDYDGDELTASPRHLVKFNASYPLYRDKLFAGLELQYTSPMHTLAGNSTDDFLLTNVTLFGQRLWKGLELSASIYNLFDVHYGYPGAAEHTQDVIGQDGRTFRLKLTYHF